MNKLLFFITTISLFGCSINPFSKNGQDYIYKEQYHYGVLNKNILMNHDGYSWFSKQYDQYQPIEDKLIKLNFSDIDIRIFMGTWCHDSKREVPRLIKILDNLKYDYSKLIIIGLTKDKKGYFKDYSKFNILNTPTIIFYRNDQEIGRIIERPKDSLEYDIFLIIGDK
jgi:thiol-disulfide isomerase/thioredoxin